MVPVDVEINAWAEMRLPAGRSDATFNPSLNPRCPSMPNLHTMPILADPQNSHINGGHFAGQSIKNNISVAYGQIGKAAQDEVVWISLISALSTRRWPAYGSLSKSIEYIFTIARTNTGIIALRSLPIIYHHYFPTRDYAPWCHPRIHEQFVEDILDWVIPVTGAKDPLSLPQMKGVAGIGKSAIAQTCVGALKEIGQLGAVVDGRDKAARFIPNIVLHRIPRVQGPCQSWGLSRRPKFYVEATFVLPDVAQVTRKTLLSGSRDSDSALNPTSEVAWGTSFDSVTSPRSCGGPQTTIYKRS
ncbi:hypothetical protein P691DRAFT_791672 [Macrolepiota fuliginosa MF-IS2]|uniref:Uncharacterized protein n=1 Tax=Macrolepiota fuliginosa MF-IS2 TaxID=1400762 RepID=A0A9P5XCY8_9AGAR|nr:hypothetical protein P691DRAFT_791672 [Macrolepiota fuliginosa MF-IS2]